MTPAIEALEALARRAVACRGWRWMPGMLRLRDAPGKADHLRRERRIERADDWFYSDWPCLPDLTDPATLGCLLALVREAWGLRDVGMEYDLGDRRWNGQEYWTDETPPRAFLTLLDPTSLVALLERAP